MKRIVFIGAILLVPCCALGRIRVPVYDFQLAECELVVVARIEPGTLKRVVRKSDVKLVVTETLKGVAPGKIFDVRTNALVVMGGYHKGGGRTVNLRAGGRDYPKTKIILHDGKLSRPGPRMDMSRNAIWFLRKSKDKSRYILNRSGYIQPTALKPYFIALLSGDRAKALTMLSHKDQAIRMRVLKHLSGFHRPRDVGHVLPLLRDESVAVQSLAAQTAAEIADATAAGGFRKALGHKNPEVRTVAAIFLSRFRDVQSIPAIAKAVAGLQPLQQQRVLGNLGRMGSRKAVPVLLEFLDEHLSPGRPSDGRCYQASKAAAASLRELTGVRFPLNAPEGRRQWQRLKGIPGAILIRKGILAEIEDLTHNSYTRRWEVYRRLGRLANRYSVFYRWEDKAGREKSRALWRRWAGENLARSRLEWIHDGFKASRIALPRPMDRKGIDTLIEVLAYYADWNKQGAAGRPLKWDITGRWRQADLHRYNANLLLERYTGHTVGLSPYHRDLGRSWQDRAVLADRWAAWWRKHRDGIKLNLKPSPGERWATADTLSKVPDIPFPPAPIQVTIRTSRASYTLRGPIVVHVQVKNISSRAITIAKRPLNLIYAYRSGMGVTGYADGSGRKKEDLVTLKPGRTLKWKEPKAAFTHLTKPRSFPHFHYRLTYPFAGSQFGLRAWRGEVTSNRITYALTK